MSGALPFSGVKVLDVASFIAAPMAATVLADFGADVIKVEPPGQGDPQRFLSYVPPNPIAKANYDWHLTNRNKRGMVINLKSPGGTEILRRLVEWADVVITNYPHGVRESLHLGYDEVSSWNPRVIYADITGFGDAGPDATLPGFDVSAFWSRSGLLSSFRDAGAPPTVPVYGSGDFQAAIGIYAAIVTALYRRERTGAGANVGTSLLAEGIWSAASLVSGALANGRSFGLHDRAAPFNPFVNPYQTADDRWFMLVAQPKDLPALAKAIGHPELLTDPRFADLKGLIQHGAALGPLFDSAFRAQPFAHWEEILDRERVTWSVIQTPDEAARDPQLRAADIVVPIEGVSDLEYTINNPVIVRGVQKVPARRAPELGEHTDEVLVEMGFSNDEIEQLRAAGTVPKATELEAVR